MREFSNPRNSVAFATIFKVPLITRFRGLAVIESFNHKTIQNPLPHSLFLNVIKYACEFAPLTELQ